jgi:hypothetical protein
MIKLVMLVEAAVVVAVAVVIWLSFTYDHEGEWVDLATGEMFRITRSVDRCVATSNQRSIPIEHGKWPWTTEFQQVVPGSEPLYGTYDRWRGRIEWRATTSTEITGPVISTWARFSSGASHTMNWIHARNLFQHGTVAGSWIGATASGAPIYMQIAPKNSAGIFTVGLCNGPLSESVEAVPTADGGLKMTNHLNETFIFSWGGRDRGTLAINNGNVVMNRLD